LGALVAALGLAGCGRKSGLDAPPMAAAGDMQTSPQPAAGDQQTSPQPAAAPASAGKPVTPTPDKRKTVFDWLID
jgi:predicted small lipoprotein YifL